MLRISSGVDSSEPRNSAPAGGEGGRGEGVGGWDGVGLKVEGCVRV